VVSGLGEEFVEIINFLLVLLFLLFEHCLMARTLGTVLAGLILVDLLEFNYFVATEGFNLLLLEAMSIFLSLEIFSILLVKGFHLGVLCVALLVVTAFVILSGLVPLLLTLGARVLQVSNRLVVLVQLVMVSRFLSITGGEVLLLQISLLPLLFLDFLLQTLDVS